MNDPFKDYCPCAGCKKSRALGDARGQPDRDRDGVPIVETSGLCQCGAATTRRLFGGFACVGCVPVRVEVPPETFGAGHRPMRKP